MVSSMMELHVCGGGTKCFVTISFACKRWIAAPYFEGSLAHGMQALVTRWTAWLHKLYKVNGFGES